MRQRATYVMKHLLSIALFCSMLLTAIAANAAQYIMYLDPYTTDWADTWCYIFPNKAGSSSTSYNYYANTAIAAAKAELDDTGWLKVEFETDATIFDVHFRSNEMTSSIYYTNSYSAGYNNLFQGITESTYFVVENEYLKKTDYRPLTIIESNTFSVHVTTAGSLGNVIMQYITDWTDIAKLTVTGSLNADDMKYFARMTNIQELDLSGTDITTIATCNELSRLKKVVLPSSVTTIADNAFSNDSRLADINLDNVETIGNYAFSGCNSITSLTLPKCQALGNGAFALYYRTYQSEYVSTCYTDRGLISIDLPNAKSLGNWCFGACGRLEQINIPLVETIGYDAFCNCIALTQIDISSATNIEYAAFGFYPSLTPSLRKVVLSDDLESIPEFCFYYAKYLENINFPRKLKTIHNYAFYSVKISHALLPEGLTSVESYNFNYSDTITLPSTLTTFKSYYLQWKHIYSYLIQPLALSFITNLNNSFDNDTLHVPAFSVSTYKLDDYWYRFGKIVALDEDLNKINITGDFTFYTTGGIAEKADMIIYPNGQLTTSADQTINLGQYTQYIGTSTSYRHDIARDENNNYMYDDNGNYVYVYSKAVDNTGTLLANSPLTADNAVYLINAVANRWIFISLPFDVNIEDISCTDNAKWVIREYNSTNRALGTGETWQNVATDGVLKAYKGYILYCNAQSVFSFPAANETRQNLFAVDNQQVNLTQYEAEYLQNRNWNLVGNPYPCFFDIKMTDFTAPMTMWNGRGYTAYSPLDDEYILRPAEAFFVQAPQGTSSITFSKAGRNTETTYTVSTYEYNNRSNMQARRITGTNADRRIFNFIVSGNDYSDRARIVFNEQALATYEIEHDAVKMMSSDNSVPQLFVNDEGIHYAICERPMMSGVATLGFHAATAGEYSLYLEAANDDYTINLTDTETGECFELGRTPYTFTSNQGDYPQRFRLSIKQKMPTEIETISTDQQITIDGKTLTIRTPQLSEIALYTLDGKTIVRRYTNEMHFTLAFGTYIVSIDGNQSKVVVK